MEIDGDDLDLGDLASATTTTGTSATSRFAPKQKGKPVKLDVPKPEPAEIKPQIPNPTIKNNESELSMDCIGDGKDDQQDNDPVQSNDDHHGDPNDDEIENEDEVLIQEINVYLTAPPLAEDTSLYVMQYPLRPSWRPYELNEICKEVRVQPKQLKVEIDLRLDVGAENPQKQTLSSSRGTSKPYFAIGIRTLNQLHLNPIDAVLQLRPSKICTDTGEQMKKQTAPSQDVQTKTLEQGKPVSGDLGDNLAEDEPWVQLEFEPSDSAFADDYRRKMVAEKNNDIQFAMKQFDFLDFLCPGTSSNKKGAIGPPRRDLLLMPLEERLKKWLSEGPQVNRFAYLLHLAPADSIEDVLKVLQQYADLVQGLWVTKSSLIYDGFQADARDYILSQFSKNNVIRYEKKRPPPPFVRQIMTQLAVQRLDLCDWKFKEPADLSFIKSFPNVVKDQENSWADRAEQLVASLHGVGKTKESQAMDSLVKSLNPHMLKKTVDLGKVDQYPKNGIDKIVSSTETIISSGAREDLVKALLDTFQLHSVQSLNMINKELKGRINVSIPVLQSALSEVAVDVHGVYVLKSLRNPALDPLRNFIISLFRQKKANARFREGDVRKAAQSFLKRNISDSEFKQVVDALCNSKGGLTFKNGDAD